MGCVSSKPSQEHGKPAKEKKGNMISLEIRAPLPQCAIEDHVPTEHHPTICTILLEALFDFQSTYWQQALGCFPEPQVQMVRMIRNCSENTVCNVVLTLDQSSGAMQFVDNLDQFGPEELFFWVAKEGLGVQTKYLLVNANRTRVICIQHPHVIAEHISTISASNLCSQNKYYFELPARDVPDNALLMAFNPNQCPACSLEYEPARRRPMMGAQQFRFNIQTVTYLPLPKCTNTVTCNPAT